MLPQSPDRAPTGRAAALLSTLALLATAFALPGAAQPPADLELQGIVGGLITPVAVRHAGDGSGRLFIVEQPGRILIWDGSMLLPTPFLDITSLVDDTGGEQGLLGLAFHPDFESNGFFYVDYTRDPGPGLDRTVIARYTVSAGDPNVANPASAVTLMEIEQDFVNHNGGDIHFGPDGYLYIAMGDGGSGGDPNDRAQDLGELLGKLLRIDVDGTPPPAPNDLCGLNPAYGIPADNPFAGGSGDCDEIWALGLRNPWRFSFDRHSGALFIADVGQGTWEEIDYQPPGSTGGENWGWRCYEGNAEFNLADCGPMGTYDFPIFEYNHSLGCSVTGGFRYRGNDVVGFPGTYVYADYCSGRVWFGTEEPGGGWTSSLWMDTAFNVSSFGEDEDGELYLVNHGGQIYRFESDSSIFTDGFESGDTTSWTATAVP